MAEEKTKRRRVSRIRRINPDSLDTVPAGILAIQKVEEALKGTDIKIANFGLHDGFVFHGRGSLRLCLEVWVSLDNPPIRKR